MTGTPALKDINFLYLRRTHPNILDSHTDWHTNMVRTGFNVGMNIGICAGQTILWPHIHFIPRHDDDAPEIGGMRHAHPGADHKRYY